MTPKDRSQRRAAERRAQILKAAIHLFAQRGFHATTTREIASAADLSEGTLYNYFDNKEHIFAALVEKLINNQNLLFTKSLPIDTQSFIDSLLENQHGFLQENLELVRAVLPELLINNEFQSKYFHDFYSPTVSFLLLQLQARDILGQIRPINHEMVARILIALLYGLSFLHLIDDPVVNDRWESLLGQAVTLFYEGMIPV